MQRLKPIFAAAATLALAFAGGAAATLLAIPAGWLSGAMIAVTAATLAGMPTRLPRFLSDVAFVLVGALLGAGVTPDIVEQAVGWPLTLLGLAVATAAVVFAVRTFLVRVAGWDRQTAFFAALPGALSYVLVLANESRADIRRVAVSQTIRLFLLVAVIPPIVAFAEGGALTPIVRTAAAPPALVAMIAASAAGGLLFARLRIPAGLLSGSILASSLVHAVGWVEGSLPDFLVIATFVTLGALIGGRFAGTDLRFLGKVAVAGVGAFAIAFAVSSALAWTMSLWVDVPTVQILVAFAPGGLDAMTALAIALHLDSAFVAVHQLVRFMAIATFAPLLARRVAFGSEN